MGVYGLGNVNLRIVDDEIAVWCPTSQVEICVFEEISDCLVVWAEGDAAFGFVFRCGLFDGEVLFFGGAAAVCKVFGVYFGLLVIGGRSRRIGYVTISSIF